MDTSAFTFNSLALDESRLKDLRKELYHSERPGYVVIPGFLSAENVEHLRKVWTSPGVQRFHKPFKSKNQFYLGCPNYFRDNQGNHVFHNFLWAKPLDELSHVLTLQFQILRNRIEGKCATDDIFPTNGRSVAYRVVVSRNEASAVKPHTDYYHPETPLDKLHDMARLQGTLILSKYGKDYEGGGFNFKNNQGNWLTFGRDVEINPGDLVYWHYQNEHAVAPVTTKPGQIGFVRYIFPPEIIFRGPPFWKINLGDMRGLALSAVPRPVKNRIKTLLGKSTT